MARIDRARLDAAQFPMTAKVATRYADLDTQDHVNNVAAAGILQEARFQFDRVSQLELLKGELRCVVAALSIEFAAEMQFPGTIEVGTGILQIGRSSFVLGQLGRQDGRATLYSEAVMVFTDASGPTPIPANMRAAYESLLVRHG